MSGDIFWLLLLGVGWGDAKGIRAEFRGDAKHPTMHGLALPPAPHPQ